MGRSEIFVYNGAGASVRCVEMILASLKKVVTDLKLPFIIRCTDGKELCTPGWGVSCQLLVMPGGRDVPYCQELDGKGNQNIRCMVEEGGSYLGICAGAYYGSAYLEFAKNDPVMTVEGPRELAFFPVTAVGPVFPGFNYENNAGACAAGISVTEKGRAVLEEMSHTSLFYNGGCYFKERSSDGDEKSRAVKTVSTCSILATYTGDTVPHPSEVTPCGTGFSAIVGGRVGLGKVVLSGLHFEASPDTLVANYEEDNYIAALLPHLNSVEPQREQLFQACVKYLLTHTSDTE